MNSLFRMKLAACLCVALALNTACSKSSNEVERENQNLKAQVQELREQQHDSSPKNTSDQNRGNGDAVLEIKQLKISGTSWGSAHIDIEVINGSTKFVGFWSIKASLYDRERKYLGQAGTNGQNLRPGQSAVKTLIYDNVRSTEIASWKLEIDRIVVDTEGSKDFAAGRYFSLREVR